METPGRSADLSPSGLLRRVSELRWRDRTPTATDTGAGSLADVPDLTDQGWMEIHPVWALTVNKMPPPTTTPTTSTSTTTPPATSPPARVPPTEPPTTSPPTTAPSSGAWCQASASPANDGHPGDYDVYGTSNQPYTNATASSATDTYGYETNGSGSAVIYLWYQSLGAAITVTVGGATCYTTD